MTGAATPGLAHLRVARPTDDLAAVVRFYRDGLGLDLLSEFRDHAGFDGVMPGHRGAGYHLEFTRRAGHPAGRAPTEDNLLVFYLPDRAAWQEAVDRLGRYGYRPVPACNPYWDRCGTTFEDARRLPRRSPKRRLAGVTDRHVPPGLLQALPEASAHFR